MDLQGRSSISMFCAIGLLITICLPVSPYAAGETAHPLNRFVISEKEVEGFTVIRKPRYYGPESLWNYINGGALPYLDYGVSDVMTYRGMLMPDSLEITVDVYDMADSLGAFGIYSSERFPEFSYLNIGVEGYLTENTLCFWKDRYYVKIFTQKDSLQTPALLERIARSTDEHIPEGGSMPGYFSLFPVKDRLEHTETYKAKNVLGQDYLSNAFVVNYRRGDEEFQLYLIKSSSVSESGKNFHAYCDFLEEYGKLEEKEVSIGDEAFIGKESWYGTVLFARKGMYIVGSVSLSDQDRARGHLNAMISGLQ